MRTSYHVHSRWSDGQGEIIDIVRAAGEVGLDEVGISDHYVLPPDRRQHDWSMPIGGLSKYVDEVRSAANEAGNGLVVKLGVEADYFPETFRDLSDILAAYPFDYRIGSVHMVDGFVIDYSPDNWQSARQAERDDIIRGYWVRLKQMAETGLFDIVAHIDLTKKFAVYPSADISAEVSEALDAIARAGMAVELNTAGWYMPCAEAYPGPSILRECFNRAIPVLVTADSHAPENLTRAFPRAHRLLRDAGYGEAASFAGRRRSAHRLPSWESSP